MYISWVCYVQKRTFNAKFSVIFIFTVWVCVNSNDNTWNLEQPCSAIRIQIEKRIPPEVVLHFSISGLLIYLMCCIRTFENQNPLIFGLWKRLHVGIYTRKMWTGMEYNKADWIGNWRDKNLILWFQRKVRVSH